MAARKLERERTTREQVDVERQPDDRGPGLETERGILDEGHREVDAAVAAEPEHEQQDVQVEPGQVFHHQAP